MAKKATVKQLWMRLGDVGDYEVVDSPYDAGYRVGGFYEEVEPEIKWTRRMGVEVAPGFTNYNYVSLFWGDDDAQPLWPLEKAGLTASQKAKFKRGVLEGAGFDVHPKKLAKPKPRKQKTRTASVKGLRGKR